MPIVYDEAHSIQVGLPNMNCVPQIQAQCAREVPLDAADFAHQLVLARNHLDECTGISLFVDQGNGTSEVVNQVKQGKYWQLSLDYKPGMRVQAFRIHGVNGGGPGTQGDGFDAYSLMQTVCQVSSEGGEFIYW